MKISQQKLSKKRWLIITLVIAIVLLGVGIGVYALQNNANKKPTPSSDKSTSQNDSDLKISTDPPTSNEIDAGNATKSNNNAGQDPSPSDDKTLSITANNTGSTIQIRSTIAAQPESGNCSLVLTKGDETITKDTVGIQALPGYSTCKGWDIDTSTLSSGSWTANVTATYGSTSSKATAEFQI